MKDILEEKNNEPDFECHCGAKGNNEELIEDEYEPNHFIYHCPICDSANLWYNKTP